MTQDNYPFVLVVNSDTGNEALMTRCVNFAYCQSEPFLSDAQHTPSVTIDGKRRPLCQPCARATWARLQAEGKPVPTIDWQLGYPSWHELMREQ